MPTPPPAGSPAYVASVLAAERTGAPPPVPGTLPGERLPWNLVQTADHQALHRVAAPVDARMPRGVSIDVDLSAIPARHRVAFLAIAGSRTDPYTAAAGVPASASPVQLARQWPHAALRVVQAVNRPT